MSKAQAPANILTVVVRDHETRKEVKKMGAPSKYAAKKLKVNLENSYASPRYSVSIV